MKELDTRVDGQPDSHVALPQGTPDATRATKIKNGVEFFRVGGHEDCQCARCGSSCFFVDCGNCGGEGEVEDDDWQSWDEYHRCDWCLGTGGWYRCVSSADWCEANPMAGRENQPVMGIKKGERYD